MLDLGEIISQLILIVNLPTNIVLWIEKHYSLFSNKNSISMKLRCFQILSLSLFITFLSCNQKGDSSRLELIQLVEKISSEPVEITYRNSLPVNNEGGHLQGIQYFSRNENDYYFLSGSSDSYSYYSIVKLGEENLVASTNTILEKPFKHAGGFQIHNDLMAIGIEDNEVKNISKVFIYQIDDPNSPSDKPIKIIERVGAIKRATAGCIGITEIDGEVMVVVGDWDTAHLDFYRIDRDKLGQKGAAFKLDYSVVCQEMDRTGWIDENWLSYQNINFIKDTFGQLYLAGMTSNDAEENILDLFEIEIKQPFTPKLIKVYSKNFNKNTQAKFRWGAGVHLDENNKLRVITCGENILDVSAIHVYK